MTGMVVKQWYVNRTTPDKTGAYVRISGREGGLIAWAMALLGIDPTTTLSITALRAEFTTSSLAGHSHRMIPLEHISSTYYGYHRPWKEAVGLFFLFMFGGTMIGAALSEQGGGGGAAFATLTWSFFLGVIVGAIYYFLNRSLTVGLVEVSGLVSHMQVKKSVVEAVDVDEAGARAVCDITEMLLEQARRAYMNGNAAPAMIHCGKCGTANPATLIGRPCSQCGVPLD